MPAREHDGDSFPPAKLHYLLAVRGYQQICQQIRLTSAPIDPVEHRFARYIPQYFTRKAGGIVPRRYYPQYFQTVSHVRSCSFLTEIIYMKGGKGLVSAIIPTPSISKSHAGRQTSASTVMRGIFPGRRALTISFTHS
jgi:hypothetical protein